MPVFYEIDKEKQLVRTSGRGDVTCQEMLDHQVRLTNDADFNSQFSQLNDATQPTTIEFTPDCIRRLARRSLFAPNARRAIVADKDYVYAHARMFEILREFEGEVGIRVFRSLEEAQARLTASNFPAKTLN